MTMAVLPHVLAATKSSGGGSIGFLVVIVIIGIAGYFFFLRPQQQKARKQKAQQQDVGVGDEVMTIGGIVGTILDMENDRVTIITGLQDGDEGGSPGQPTRIVLIRSAIARKVEPVVNDPDSGADGSPDAELHYDDSTDDDTAEADGGDGERRADGGSGEGKGP
ncbi:MAG TPA: preprotein translocase subunit YajC [Acidimicrobiales bacterium]